jgi:hypothetical protein
MEGHNERHTPVTSDGKLSVVLENSDGTPSVVLKKAFVNDHLRKVLSSGPLTPEQLADIWDEAPTRRAWWLDLHSSADIHAGTTISDLQQAVEKHRAGSIGQLAAAPVSFDPERCACNGPGCPDCSAALTMPVCECRQPVASLIPFDWQCAKCKGVIPSPASYSLTADQRRDYLEAL